MLSSNDATKLADWLASRVTAALIEPIALRRCRSVPALADVGTLVLDDLRRANGALSRESGH